MVQQTKMYNKMFALRFMPIFAVLNVVVLARPSIVDMGENAPKFIKFSTAYKSAITFQCKPQPRAFLARDLLKEYDASITLQPNNIVLHRCDHQSGCCMMANEVCGENTAEEVIFELRAQNTFTHAVSTINIQATNHTSCKCAPGSSSPKRINDNDARVESLTSAGLTNHSNDYKLLCVASLLYFIYLSYSFCY